MDKDVWSQLTVIQPRHVWGAWMGLWLGMIVFAPDASALPWLVTALVLACSVVNTAHLKTREGQAVLPSNLAGRALASAALPFVLFAASMIATYLHEQAGPPYDTAGIALQLAVLIVLLLQSWRVLRARGGRL